MVSYFAAAAGAAASLPATAPSRFESVRLGALVTTRARVHRLVRDSGRLSNLEGAVAGSDAATPAPAAAAK